MNLGELLKNTSGNIELHSGFNGRLIASTPKSLEIFKDVEVLGIYPRIKVTREREFAIPFLYVFGDNNSIQKIRKLYCNCGTKMDLEAGEDCGN